jgi:TusA-related sulfurtransferase
VTTKTDFFLDITEDVCPMTFVKTRLLIERMAPGDLAEILLKGEEPLRNVPDSVTELGHEIVALAAVDPSRASHDDVHRLLVRKGS